MSGGDHDAPLLAEDRRERVAAILRDAGTVTVGEVERRFGVSTVTARRDLVELERRGVARRTHGGAVLPSVTAHEDSFAERVDAHAAAKRALARAAVDLVDPGQTVLLDSSSTAYHVARELLDRTVPATVVTNSLAIMDLVCATTSPRVELIGIGGQLRALSRSFVGPAAVAMIRSLYTDRLFLSVKGITSDGALTDPDPFEAEVKRAMVAQAADAVVLVDASKVGVWGLARIASLAEVSAVLVHGVDASDTAGWRAAGVEVHDVSLVA